jgi:hypothetical protein
MYEGVMAGVDRSPSAMDAALWAADEAALRGLRLELVHAGRSAADGREVLEETAGLIGESHPQV